MYTWWSWHICRGEGVGVELDQHREEREVFWCSLDCWMALILEYCFDPLWLGSSGYVGCVALSVRFRKCLRSSKLEFGAKSYRHFSAERSAPDARWPEHPVSTWQSDASIWCSVFSISKSHQALPASGARPVAKKRLWNLSIAHWTLGSRVRWFLFSESSQYCMGERVN
jgi:hypothetical protein